MFMRLFFTGAAIVLVSSASLANDQSQAKSGTAPAPALSAVAQCDKLSGEAKDACLRKARDRDSARSPAGATAAGSGAGAITNSAAQQSPRGSK